MRKTKTICTIGPSSSDLTVLEEMWHEGMDCIRINTAYGSLEKSSEVIENIRKIGDIPVMVDLKGPELRLEVDNELIVDEGEEFGVGRGNNQSFNHEIYDQLKENDLIYLDNGKFETRVKQVSNDSVIIRFEVPGEIKDGKGVNIPGKNLPVPTLSEKDKRIIEFSKEKDVEFIALSFVRNKEDIVNLKNEAEGFGGSYISKIEDSQGLENFEEILEESDGIIVARGDLGIEISLERVPLAQKKLIKKCNAVGKPVITATELLESMIENQSPTRAEVSDIANAILDGTDSLMLSGETAIGKYPVRSLEMIKNISEQVEPEIKSRVDEKRVGTVPDALSRAVLEICESMDLDKVIALTESGYTAKMLTKFRLSQPIVGVTPSVKTKRELGLVYGVKPVRYDFLEEKKDPKTIINSIRDQVDFGEDDTVLLVSAPKTAKRRGSGLLEIVNLSELSIS